MKKVRSLLAKFFKSRYDVSEPKPEAAVPLFNPLCILRGNYEFKSGAVAIVRIESPLSRSEMAYYPEQSADFFRDVVASLKDNKRVTVQTNLDPVSLGFRTDDSGNGMISPTRVLGEA